MMKKNLLIVCLLLALPFPTLTRAAPEEMTFPSRGAAVETLAAAVSEEDHALLLKIFGSEYAAFQKGQAADPALQDLRSQRFVKALGEFHTFRALGEDRYTLIVGAMAWPFPIPIVRSGGEWHFDGAAGVEELRNRIVGANELNAIATLDRYAAAQRRYSLEDYDGDGVLEYAELVISSPGKRDGLFWDDRAGDETLSPLEHPMRLADALLGEREKGAPFLGYHFRILHSQGANAKAGAYDYRINGHLLGGFAMLAWPANYGETGVMTFLINQDQVVYQTDLGPDTGDAVNSITSFDPDKRWIAVDDSEPGGTSYTPVSAMSN